MSNTMTSDECLTTKRIMVIDDDPMIRFLVQEYLTVLGYSVQAFEGGAEALATLGSSLPDLVVLDMQMPDMNGVEVLKRIRENPDTSGVPVLMLSANANEAKDLAGPKADSYLEKPFQMQTLLEAVRSTQRDQS